jgi:hypothetical protein
MIHDSKKTAMILEKGQVSMDPLPNAEKDGYIEIARIWKRKSPTGQDEDQFVTQVRQAYSNVNEWHLAFASFAQTLTVMFKGDQTDDKTLYKHVTNLLWSVADSFSALTNIYPPGHSDGIHPGVLVPGEEVMHREDAIQILGVWQVPLTEDCEDCGDDHMAQTYIQGDSDALTPTDFGELLASIAEVQANESTGLIGEQFKILGEIQAAFLKRMSEGVAVA